MSVFAREKNIIMMLEALCLHDNIFCATDPFTKLCKILHTKKFATIMPLKQHTKDKPHTSDASEAQKLICTWVIDFSLITKSGTVPHSVQSLAFLPQYLMNKYYQSSSCIATPSLAGVHLHSLS